MRIFWEHLSQNLEKAYLFNHSAESNYQQNMDDKTQYLPLKLQSRLDHFTQVSQLSISSHNQTITNLVNSSTKASSEDKDQLSQDSQKSQVPFTILNNPVSKAAKLAAHLSSLLNHQKRISKKICSTIEQTEKIIEANKQQNDMVEQIVCEIAKKVEEGRKDIVILYQIVNKKKREQGTRGKQILGKGLIQRQYQSKRNSFRPLPKNNSQQKLIKSFRMTTRQSTSRLNSSILKRQQNNAQEKEQMKLVNTKSVSPYGLKGERGRGKEQRKGRKLKIGQRR